MVVRNARCRPVLKAVAPAGPLASAAVALPVESARGPHDATRSGDLLMSVSMDTAPRHHRKQASEAMPRASLPFSMLPPSSGLSSALSSANNSALNINEGKEEKHRLMLSMCPA